MEPPMMPSSPRSALVTGAAKRIGRAIALGLADDGYGVALHCHRSHDEAKALAAEILATGGRAAVIAGDFADAEAVAGILPAAIAALGPLTLLVNNASTFEVDMFGAL